MQDLICKYEEEKRRLNELGQASIDLGIPLSCNEAVQAQSRKVDEIINQLYQEKMQHAATLHFFDHYQGGDGVNFPTWFLQAMQRRLDEVSAQVEHSNEFERVFEEESKAFDALFTSMDIARKPEFADWEDKFQSKQAVLYEHLYLQGLKDGMQLANTFSVPSVLMDQDTPIDTSDKSS